MPDLGDSVDYEFLYRLELADPSTDEPTGVIFMIRSAAAEEVQRVVRRHTDANIDRRIKNKALKGEMLERQILERAAAYVASWDWGNSTFEKEVPEYSTEKVIYVLKKKPWIREQVEEAANDITNFS